MLGQVGEDRAASPIKLSNRPWLHVLSLKNGFGSIIDQSIAQQSVDL